MQIFILMAINNLYEWFCFNRLSLNACKTKYIVLRPKHMRYDLSRYNINIGNTQLSRIGNDCLETSSKFLGMHLDENLTWKTHTCMNEIYKIMSRELCSIKQVKNTLPLESLKTLYFALIHPHLLYGIIAWGNADMSIIRQAILLQKRAFRIITNSAYNSHTDPKFRKQGILKLNDLFEYQSILSMYDYMSGNLPRSFVGTLPLNQDMQQAHTTVNLIFFIFV